MLKPSMKTGGQVRFGGLAGLFLAAALSFPVLLACTAVAAPGDLDRSFGHGGRVKVQPSQVGQLQAKFPVDMATESGGRILLLNQEYTCSTGSCEPNLSVTRYFDGGRRDASYGGRSGSTKLFVGSAGGSALAVDSKDRAVLLVAGAGGLYLARLDVSGRLDRSFGTGGLVTLGCACEYSSEQAQIAIDANGRIVVEAKRLDRFDPVTHQFDSTEAGMYVLRLLPNGRLDQGFGVGGWVAVPKLDGWNAWAPQALAIQTGGSILSGEFGCCLARSFLTRVSASGRNVDRDFGTAIPPVTQGEATITSIFAQADGDVVVLGNASNRGGFAVRLRPDGGLDRSFGREGLTWFHNQNLGGGVVDRRGRIFVIGSGGRGVVVFRLLADGRLDRTFRGGISAAVTSGNTGAVVALSRQHPVVLDRGLSSCRGYCPSDPVLIRFVGGSSGARCLGRRATVVGTRGKDVLVGTRHDDVIVGLGGQDRIHGRGGDDLLCGGRGRDGIVGGSGSDRRRQ